MTHRTCRNGHIRTPLNNYARPSGYLECRECVNARQRAKRACEEAGIPRTPQIVDALARARNLSFEDCCALLEGLNG